MIELRIAVKYDPDKIFVEVPEKTKAVLILNGVEQELMPGNNTVLFAEKKTL